MLEFLILWIGSLLTSDYTTFDSNTKVGKRFYIHKNTKLFNLDTEKPRKPFVNRDLTKKDEIWIIEKHKAVLSCNMCKNNVKNRPFKIIHTCSNKHVFACNLCLNKPIKYENIEYISQSDLLYYTVFMNKFYLLFPKKILDENFILNFKYILNDTECEKFLYFYYVVNKYNKVELKYDDITNYFTENEKNKGYKNMILHEFENIFFKLLSDEKFVISKTFIKSEIHYSTIEVFETSNHCEIIKNIRIMIMGTTHLYRYMDIKNLNISTKRILEIFKKLQTCGYYMNLRFKTYYSETLIIYYRMNYVKRNCILPDSKILTIKKNRVFKNKRSRGKRINSAVNNYNNQESAKFVYNMFLIVLLEHNNNVDRISDEDYENLNIFKALLNYLNIYNIRYYYGTNTLCNKDKDIYIYNIINQFKNKDDDFITEIFLNLY